MRRPSVRFKYHCGQKLQHETQESANEQISQLVNDGKAANELNSYQCIYCGWWHVGRVSPPSSVTPVGAAPWSRPMTWTTEVPREGL